jgi:hypothetical protein
MTRLPDWPSRLERFLLEEKDRRFRYGAFDCALFCAGCIEAMTGVDIALPYRKRGYASRYEALDLAQDLAGERSIEAIAGRQAQHHGMPEVPVLKAQRGDMLLMKRPRDYSLGILGLDGQHALIAVRVGWGPWPLNRVCRAWRV